MSRNCSDSECLSQNQGPKTRRVVRKGFYFRRSDGQRIQRYACLSCQNTFSAATGSPCFGQKKRKANFMVEKLLCSGVSQRRAAIVLGLNRKTIVRKFRFLAEQARLEQQQRQQLISKTPLRAVQFDDLETSEHTKCKPISVALAVEPKSRTILAFKVSRMPAKGLLAAVARRKYGPRRDERPTGWNEFFHELKPLVSPQAEWLSDENPHYPRFLKRHHPQAQHKTVPGQRGCSTGQGELKKVGFDPLFSLNHSCAMLRANLNRLFRRTWCTTKTLQGLMDHLSLYVSFHNRFLVSPCTG